MNRLYRKIMEDEDYQGYRVKTSFGKGRLTSLLIVDKNDKLIYSDESMEKSLEELAEDILIRFEFNEGMKAKIARDKPIININ